MNEEKTYVEDVDRSIYDFKDDEKDAFKLSAGLTPAIVEQISREKHDPAWMQLFRLQSLQIYQNMRVPDWGPSIEGLNMDNIVTYVRPNTGMKAKWSDVPEDIKTRLSGWAFRRRSANRWRAWARSMTPNWSITMCARKLPHRASFTPTWKAR